MSRGVLVFAFNSPTVDYISIADKTSMLTQKALNLPITLVTDDTTNPKFNYDKVIRIDSSNNTTNIRTDFNNQTITWRNFGRYLAYELSTYDETLLLDTDYLVLDDSLLKLFETDFDYKLMHHNRDTNGPSYEEMGNTSLPFIWATVVLFRKTHKSNLFFDLVGRIQRNYHYYSQLYNIRERNYRNDYAFAIANNILNGYGLNEDQGIPWTMLTLEQQVQSIHTKGSLLAVHCKDKSLVIPKQNLHVMDKDYLLSKSFDLFVEEMSV
jgi:hypothetical protein